MIYLSFTETSRHCQLSTQGVYKEEETLLFQEEEENRHKKCLFLC